MTEEGGIQTSCAKLLRVGWDRLMAARLTESRLVLQVVSQRICSARNACNADWLVSLEDVQPEGPLSSAKLCVNDQGSMAPLDVGTECAETRRMNAVDWCAAFLCTLDVQQVSDLRDIFILVNRDVS